MSDHQSWFHQEVQRKANVSSSYAIRRQDISKSAQRFQIAIDEAKVRLRLALSLGTWLMPSNLLLDTQSAVGYNSSLKKATSEMKFRVNSSVNLETKSVGVGLMNGVHQRSTNRGLKPLARPLSDKPLGGNYHLNWNSSDDTPKVK